MIASPLPALPRTARGQLEPTRTWLRRWWLWIDTPGLPCDGVLVLGQVAAKGYELDEQSYGVQEIRCSWPGGRAFAVRKLGAAVGGDDEQYTTTILPRTSVCTCKAGRTRTERCRHRDALAALIQAGVLPARRIEGA
jgi:hypothetical protein